MRLKSDSFVNGQAIPSDCAVGAIDGVGLNRNPHLAWDEVPTGVKSFALVVVDPDVPTVREMIARSDVMIPRDQLRTRFVHWTMVDIPSDLREIKEGSCSQGFMVNGKSHPPGPAGARQGLNDYTAWFANDPEKAGTYYGYDGPYPPSNDLRLHRYIFRLVALDVAALQLPEHFNDEDILRATQGHVVSDAQIFGTYTLNPKLAASA